MRLARQLLWVRDMDFNNPGDAALYLWDYFYLSQYPTDSEVKPWRRIECATQRIRESEQFMTERFPPVVRLRNAKRVRRATREIVRLVGQLETIPDRRTALALGYLEALAENAIDDVKELAAAEPLH